LARSKRPTQPGLSRRTQLLIAAAGAVVAVVVLIVIGPLLRGGGQQDSTSVAEIKSQAPVDRNTIGSTSAPLTLIEYSDFQ
jgi:hypothetical protein